MTEELHEALEKFFSLPNWENRIGPWKDVNQGVRQVQAAFEKEKAAGAARLKAMADVVGALEAWQPVVVLETKTGD